MDSQFLIDALIELSPQLLTGGGDEAAATTGSQVAGAEHPDFSNKTMVDLGKKLLQAASENDVDSVKALMTGGAPFTGNWLGTTPLHAAAKAGHIETVELLLNAGIFRDAKTKVDRTALQMAAEEGHTAIVRMLIDRSADVNARDMLKMTALHWAAERGHRDSVAVLLQHGADVRALNKFEKTPVDIARDKGYDDILHLLQTWAEENGHKESLEESHTATEKLMNELAAADKSTGTWRPSAEEEALEKLTASAPATVASAEAAKLLESHGITLLPVDNSTVLTSALESGQRLSLTEAGKMALSQTKQPPGNGQSPAKKFKLATVRANQQPAAASSPRIVTMTADQFLALAGRLQQSKGGKPMVITLPKKITLNNNVQLVNNSKAPAPAVAAPAVVTPPPTALTTPVAATVVVEAVVADEVASTSGDDPSVHFLRSGMLKGSARTTPMALLCRRDRPSPLLPPAALPTPSPEEEEEEEEEEEAQRKSVLAEEAAPLFDDSAAAAAAPPASVVDDRDGNAVWLSIMEEDGHLTDQVDDDDLLDPTRLAAQLASIRQAASRFSFSS